MALTQLPSTLAYRPRQDACISTVFAPKGPRPHYDTWTLQSDEFFVHSGAFVPSTAYPASEDASQTSIIATTQLASSVPSNDDPSSSQPSYSNLSGGTIAAITIGTVLAVGVVCLLLFYPQLLFAWLMKSRSRNRASGCQEVPLKRLPPQRPSRASGNDGSSNGADDAGSRRRRPEVVHGGRIQPHGNHIIIGRRSGSPVIINNNIYVDSTDYLQPLPALNSPRHRYPAPPGGGIPPNAQRAWGTRNVQFGPPPNGGIPPQRRGRGVPPAPPPRPLTAEESESSGFWNVADWARGVVPGQLPHSPAGGRAGSPLGRREQSAMRQAEGVSTQERALNIPGAFPEDQRAVERFQLVTAPARVHAPNAPTHGDNGFWVRDARENRWRRQEQEDRRDRQEREDKRERQEREERRERDRHDRDERRERDRIEREDRRERQEREERRERQEREDRRERQDGMR
ncbi:MAG: hypothetical protein Q9161_008326 [Pseudevernia consocians]